MPNFTTEPVCFGYSETSRHLVHGFLVGQSDIATDYYQGDERKYLLTYPNGAGEVFVDLVEYDASVQAIQSQVSFTIVDPETDEPIGAATVGLNGNML